ncbi:MAG TPA: hypothetical protein VK003_04435 [Oceanobacillus sp.]|nr:hypothetical protein [Oceanobacillus sp.]
MITDEKIEQTRQAIMRIRELLDILKHEVEQGEERYKQLFAQLTPEQMATLKEKDLQLQAAYYHVEDPTAIADTALQLRFVCRNLERDFEQIHDNLMAE